MIIRGNDLRVRLGGTTVLSELRISIQGGKWIALLGPNGSGKTTLLRSMAGLLEYEGSLTIGDVEVRDWARTDLARKLAFVRQSVPLAFDFRVLDLVLLGRSPHKRWLAGFDTEDHQLAEAALRQVDLVGMKSRSIHALSAGEQQRVFLAQALVQEPDILLLDEPTAHLDIHHQLAFLERVSDFVAAGHTVVAAFHDLELASQYVDEVVVLHEGQLAATGPPREALTSEVIARVFRVRATVTHANGGIAGIRYHGNLGVGDTTA